MEKYKKPSVIKIFERAYTRWYYTSKYPEYPDVYWVMFKFRDGTANQLTQLIIKFCQYNGWQAERVSSSGRFISSKPKYDIIGRQQIGGGVWIPPTSTKGTADISATINGLSVKIEVKIGNDRQSQSQKKYQSSVEDAGGIYLIAKNFDQFLNELTVKNIKWKISDL